MSLKERWKFFLKLIFDPWIIILIISTVLLTNLLTAQKDATIQGILTLLISVCSGIIGSVITKRLDEFTEGKIIVARAKTASRNLQNQFQNVLALENRVRTYLKRLTDTEYSKQISQEVVKTYFEEIIENCLSLQERVLYSLDDWKDVLPDLDISKAINHIRDLQRRIEEFAQQNEQLDQELKDSINKSSIEIEQLQAEKEKNEKKVALLQTELINNFSFR